MGNRWTSIIEQKGLMMIMQRIILASVGYGQLDDAFNLQNSSISVVMTNIVVNIDHSLFMPGLFRTLQHEKQTVKLVQVN